MMEDDDFVLVEGGEARPESGRLYSAPGPRLPVDVVAVAHVAIHFDLDRWGRWNRERYQQQTCESIEKNFEETGGRQAKKAVVALPPDARLRRMEEIVVALIQDDQTEAHGETLRQFYCRRWAPKTICWAHHLQYEGFGAWMFLSRALVLGRLYA